MIVRAALAIALLGIGIGNAAADDRCAVPLADWQPRAVLQRRLEGAGWTVLRIRTDDGCYKVIARDADGRTVKARFDPASLERVASEPDRHGRHGEGHDDHD